MRGGLGLRVGPSLATLAEWSPASAFVAFLALHAVIWSLLPTLLYPNLPLDLIEALTFGRQWQLGYDKLPPLPWWLVEAAHRVITADMAYYVLGELSVVAAFAAVWATARAMLNAMGALVAVLIIDGLHYFNYTAAKFNHDVIELPFWALAGYAFRGGVRTGATKWWLLLGLAVGLAFWAKYFVVVLVIPLALFMLWDSQARARLTTLGPWLALGVALAISAPHVFWLVQHDFVPLNYVNARAVPAQGWLDHLLHPAEFAASQAFFLVPSMLIAAPLLWPCPKPVAARRDEAEWRLISWLAFGPAATLMVGSALTGRGLVAMWGYPLWLFLGVWMVAAINIVVDRLRLKRVALAWVLVFAAFALAFYANYTVLPGIDHRYRAVLFPGQVVATTLAERYRAATGQPLTYVIASTWVGGNIAHYTSEQPQVLIDGNPRRSPGVDLADLKARGALIAWIDSDPAAVPATLAAAAGGAQVQPPVTLVARCTGAVVTVGWAILPAAP